MKSKGFTLVELIVVVVVIGILSTIAASSWLSFIARQQQRSVAEQLKVILEQAKSDAKRTKSDRTVTVIRTGNSSWSYSIFASFSTPLFTPLNIPSHIVVIPSVDFRFDHRGTFYSSSVGSKVLIKSLNTGLIYCVEARTILGLIAVAEGSVCEN